MSNDERCEAEEGAETLSRRERGRGEGIGDWRKSGAL
jgi:hypothetical protein